MKSKESLEAGERDRRGTSPPATQEAHGEDASQQAQQWAATLLESISEAFLVLDAEWRFAYVNAAFERMNDVRREEILGKDHWEVYPATLGTPLEAAYRRVAAEGVTVELENRYEPWDRWFAVKAYPAPGGGVAVQVREITAERRAAVELARREEELRLITDSMPALISYVDREGIYRFANRPYEEWLGIPRAEVLGRHLREVLGETAYETVRPSVERVLAGERLDYETFASFRSGGRYVHGSYIPRVEAGQVVGYFALVADVTERKRAEDQERFLAALAAATQPLTDPDEVTAVTARLLAEHLDADRCAYAEADEHSFRVTGDYGRGVPSIVGDYGLADFGEEFAACMRANRPYVVTDAENDPRVEPQVLAAYRRAGIRSVVSVPFHKQGRLTGGMAVHQTTVRTWRDDEVELVRTVAGRCWESLERARAARRLQASEEQFRTLFASMDEGYCIIEVQLDPEGRPIDYRFLEANPAFEKHTGLTDAVGRTARELVPDLDPFWFETYGRVALTGEPVRFTQEAGAMQGRWFEVYAFRIGEAEGRKVAILFNDVTARMLAEETLKASEAWFRTLADTSPAILWVTDPEGRCTFLSRGWYDFTGQTEEEGLGLGWLDATHPDDQARVGEAFFAATSRREPFAMEYRVRGADGEYRRAIDAGRPRLGPSGEYLGYVGLVLDVTALRQTEEALRTSEERFAFVRQTSGVGFWYCDLPFDVLEWDEQVKDHFHLPPGARVTIDTFYDRIHPEDRERTAAAIQHSIANRTPYDIDYRTVDPETGTIRWIQAIGRTFYGEDGTPIRFDGVTLDVTERKRGEERLARLLAAEQRHAALLNRVATASRAVNAVLSPESIVRIVTEEARSILGARTAVTTFTLSEDCTQEVRATSGTDRAGTQAAGRGPAFDPELSVAACRENRPIRTGREGPGSCCRLAVPLVGHGGRNLGVIQLADKSEGDFTGEDEVVLLQLAAIAAVGLENARLYEQLREQDRRKDEFLATLAHELRNPLAPIRTGLAVLSSAPPEVAARTRQMMERQVGHMVRLIDDLLDVSRITRGQVELRRERVDVRTVLDAALEVSRPLIEAARHGLSVSTQGGPLPLDADATRVAQVVSNLLNNAAKYTPEGGRIELSAEREEDEAIIRVRDNGVGLAPEMLPRVFEMFTQAGRSLDRSQGGLGIGLALVRRLVEMHGGTITAESPGPGKGSTFTVRLPLAEAVETAPAPEGTGTADRGTARRILVVDDNVDAAESLAALLRLEGHVVETAHSGPAALDAARASGPDVVFLDIGLPGMSGYEVAQHLRRDESLGRVTLVAVTGWGTEDDRRRSLEAGFDLHLTKPVDPATVEPLLARLTAGNPG